MEHKIFLAVKVDHENAQSRIQRSARFTKVLPTVDGTTYIKDNKYESKSNFDSSEQESNRK